MQNEYRMAKYGLFLVANPPEKDLIEDPFLGNSAMQNYGRGGVQEADHVYALPDVSLDIKRLKSKLARHDTDCVIYCNMWIPENNPAIDALKKELAVGVRERRVVIVICRCVWNSVRDVGKTYRVPHDPSTTFVVDDPRIKIRERLTTYGLAEAEVWLQLPRHEGVAPERYDEAIENSQGSYKKLPYCWHGARAIMNQWFEWCGWLEGALKARCGKLE